MPRISIRQSLLCFSSAGQGRSKHWLKSNLSRNIPKGSFPESAILLLPKRIAISLGTRIIEAAGSLITRKFCYKFEFKGDMVRAKCIIVAISLLAPRIEQEPVQRFLSKTFCPHSVFLHSEEKLHGNRRIVCTTWPNSTILGKVRAGRRGRGGWGSGETVIVRTARNHALTG